MQQLITISEVSQLSRDMSKHVDADRMSAYIRESQEIDIKSALGDALYIDLTTNTENYSDLLNGTQYEVCGKKKVFAGLKTALAYYVYARIVKNGDGYVTRFGYVNKDSDYSNRPDMREKVMAYNDAFSIADKYLKECVEYLNDNRDKFPLYNKGGKIKANRTKFRIIGD